MRKITMKFLAFVCIATLIIPSGCNTDQVIDALKTADAVAQATIPILAPVNAPMAAVMSKVDTDLKDAVKAYQDYDAALPADKATKAQLVKATVGAIQGNLSAILADVGVKNPALLRDVTIAVAVINSSLVIVLSRVNGQPANVVQAQSLAVPALPIVARAKSAKDLKSAWNSAIKADYPKAVVK